MHQRRISPDRRIIQTTLLAIFLVIVFFPSFITGNTGAIKFFRHYPSGDYKFHETNWAALQDSRGLIYVINTLKMMTYDGVRWKGLGSDTKKVYSMDMDPHGTIYIGKKNDFGYMSWDKHGVLKYQSLEEFYTQDVKKDFGDVQSTHCFNGRVFYRARRHVFRYNPGEQKIDVLFTASSRESKLTGSYICGDDLFIKGAKTGFYQLQGDSFVHLEELSGIGNIYMAVPFEEPGKGILLATREKGFFIYKNHRLEKFPTGIDEDIIDKDDYEVKGIRAKVLKHSPGQIAIATLRKGIFIIDFQGRLKYRISKNNGLGSNNVKHVYEDREGNLWASTNRGITKIEYNSPLSYYNESSSGLVGLVQAVARYNNTLYVGTDSGVFLMDDQTGQFEKHPRLTSGCKQLTVIDDSLWVCTGTGLIVVRPGAVNKVLEENIAVLLQSRIFPNRIYASTGSELIILEKKHPGAEDQWTVVKQIDDYDNGSRYLVEDRNGHLWYPGKENHLMCLRLSSDLSEIDVEEKILFEIDKDSPADLSLFNVNGYLSVSTEKGVMRYDEIADRFIEDSRFDNWEKDGSKLVYKLVNGPDKSVYFHSGGENYRALQGKDNKYIVSKHSIGRIPIFWQVNNIFAEQNEVWWATQHGLVRFSPQANKRKSIEYHTRISEISINGEVCFTRNSSRQDVVLTYDRRSLRFTFSAPFYRHEKAIMYRYKLDGYNTGWSEWKQETYINYTNLDSGDYTFRVKAKNTFGTESKEDKFSFAIKPPWYREWWAYVLYISVGGFLLFGIYELRVKKIERDKKRLEQEVNSKTREVRDKNQLLESQATKLREMDKYKSRFFANVSHEFRTPLTLIKGPLERMLDTRRSRADKEHLQIAARNVERLEELIDRLLTLSRIESGKEKLAVKEIDAVRFLKEVSSSFEHAIKDKKLEFSFEAAVQSIPLFCSPAHMRHIFDNLLSNAVKFSESGSITLEAEIPDESMGDFPEGFLQVTVRDTGIGIPNDQLPHIFDRFAQAGVNEHRQKGFGLGLAYTWELVHLHGGKINVNSRIGENGGTEFILQFPLGKFHLDEQLLATIQTGALQEEFPVRDKTRILHPYDRRKAGKSKSAAKQTRRETILVVEDNHDMRQYIKNLLVDSYNVLEAGDGEEGINLAQKRMPDLIVSDIMMPKTGGYDLCKEIKANLETSHIPVILLTAKAGDESHVTGLECGADTYITKPFNQKILVTGIKNLIRVRENLRDKYRQLHHLKPAEVKEPSLDDKFLEKLHEMIEKNIENDELNVESLAEQMEISRVTLNSKIKSMTGDTANHFIQNYRLERAAEYLKQQAGTITEIAQRLCFSDSSHFNRKFKQKFNQTPSQYRAKYLKDEETDG